MRRERHGAQLRAHDQRLRRQVGPHWRYGHHVVARVHQRLHRQHQRVDPAGGHGDALHGNRRGAGVAGVLGGHGAGNGLAQLGQAQVVGVKGFSALQRFNGGLADEVGRDLVTLAKPKGQHVAAAQAGVGHFADFGFFEVLYGLAHGA